MSNDKPDATWHPNDGPPEQPRHSTTPPPPETPRAVSIFATFVAWVVIVALAGVIIGGAIIVGGLLFELIIGMFS